MENKKRKIVGIIILVILLVLLLIGLFNKKGTSSISVTWNIKTEESSNVDIQITELESKTDFKTKLLSLEVSEKYEITVENKGTSNAKLEKIELPNLENDRVTIETKGLKEGSVLTSEEEATFTVTVTYKENAANRAKNTKSKLTVTLYYVQDEDNSGVITQTDSIEINNVVSNNVDSPVVSKLPNTVKPETPVVSEEPTVEEPTINLEDPIIELNMAISEPDDIFLTITYPSGCENGITCTYTMYGEEHVASSSPVEIDFLTFYLYGDAEDTRIIAKTTYGEVSKETEKVLDFTEPVVRVSTSATFDSITVTVNAEDDLSEITKYEFSISSGNGEYIDNGTNNTYTFEGLTLDTYYNIYLRVTNSAGLSKRVIVESVKTKAALQKGVNIEIVKSGAGLYKEATGRYIYKGSTPNNYITFNDETWRILSIENDGP